VTLSAAWAWGGGGGGGLPKRDMVDRPPGSARTREVERVTKLFWLSFMVVIGGRVWCYDEKYCCEVVSGEDELN